MKKQTGKLFWAKVHRLKHRGYNEKDAIEKAKNKMHNRHMDRIMQMRTY